ncbi:MAG: bacterial Ig-like domain-containing protein [Clostridia bacterium]|nr:bacterial Ig-like domain-containing protein [Clostridia bacterium]
MKKSSRVILVLLMLICSAFALASCGEKVASIEIEKTPRVEFVQGQELDLTNGTLTVTYEKKTEEIALNAEGVTVSGYDKDKLGEQVITITYQEKTTELKVTVVPRISVAGATTSYFVGDSFDKEKGKLTVRKDDATTSASVNMKDTAVTVSGFDSTEAGEVTVTVSYGGYNGQFTVTVYEPIVKLSAPNKVLYDSHETELDIRGGYFTLSSEDGKLTRHVAVTEEMVQDSGFDPSLATEANSSDALKQEITITYNGKPYTYKVSILFSDVSFVKAVAKAIQTANLEWTGETPPTIEEALGEKALEAVNRSFELDEEEWSFITAEEKELVVRVGALYGFEKWSEATKLYEKTLLVKEGAISILNAGYEKMKEDHERLVLGNDDFVIIGKQLAKMAELFADITVHGEQTVKGLVDTGYNFDGFDKVVDLMGFITELYEYLEDVPENWTVAELADYSAKIENAKRLITTNGYTEYQYRALYAMVKSWRNDFFDIMYAYYYDLEDSNSLSTLVNVYLPEELEAMYTIINYGYQETLLLAETPLRDTIHFMTYYNAVMELVKELDASENQMHKDIYYEYGLANVVLNYLKTVDHGYLDLNGPMHGDQEFAAIWEKYLALYAELLEAKNADGENFSNGDFLAAHAEQIEALFDEFVAMSPAKQLGFIGSIHCDYLYKMPTTESLMFEYREENIAKSYFIYFVVNYYASVLSDEGEAVFADLMLAMELYARSSMDEESMTAFMEKMPTIKTAYAALTVDEQTLLADCYGKYATIYAQLSAEDIALGDWADEFDGLLSAVQDVMAYYQMFLKDLNDSNTFNWYYCGALMGAYGTAEKLAGAILASGDENIVKAYYNQGYTVGESEVTLDFALFTARDRLVSVLGYITVGGEMFIDKYLASDIPAVMTSVYPVIRTYVDAEKEFTAADQAMVESAMAAIREIKADELYIFTAVNGAYYQSLYAYFDAVLSDAGLAVAEKLIALEETYYFNYVMYPNGKYTDEDGNETETTSEAFMSKLAEIETLYEGLSATDKAFLEDMFDYYYAVGHNG